MIQLISSPLLLPSADLSHTDIVSVKAWSVVRKTNFRLRRPWFMMPGWRMDGLANCSHCRSTIIHSQFNDSWCATAHKWLPEIWSSVWAWGNPEVRCFHSVRSPHSEMSKSARRCVKVRKRRKITHKEWKILINTISSLFTHWNDFNSTAITAEKCCLEWGPCVSQKRTVRS